MMKKPISPTEHGIAGYVVSGALLALPTLLHFSQPARWTYAGLGTSFLTVEALTMSPAGLKKILPLRLHRKIDIAALAGTALLTATRLVRGDRKALRFHLVLLAVAAANVLLTRYED